MKILALEFSSSRRSVALAEGDSILSEAVEIGRRGTAAFAMIEKVLADAGVKREEVEMIGVGLGPGSYTGIRAAISIAQGWQMARETKTMGISSVEAIVAQAQSEKILGAVNVVIDAQRDEFYLATYEISGGGWREMEKLKIVTRKEVPIPSDKINALVGPDVADLFSGGQNIFPRAGSLAQLAGRQGRVVAAEKLEPIYLRETTFVKAAPLLNDLR